ncbi:MAG: haloacid dehalogenase type II [Sphingobium sp.]|nr:haloacid dehalogenase type II [Sphingobium sp.]
MPEVKVFAFDVFGTVVDWRSSIAREVTPLLAGSGIDPHSVADRWRARYQPAMQACRSGARPYTRLDILNRETLDDLLRTLGVEADAATRAELAMAWRRLDPWPDAVAGLTRIRARWPIVTLSNGNIALTLDMARRAGLPWDAILGAEATGIYKPLPGAYLGTADILGIAPAELCLVAAHHSDLAAARSVGLSTAFIARPLEYGGAAAPDAHMAQDWDWSATSITELASQLDA